MKVFDCYLALNTLLAALQDNHNYIIGTFNTKSVDKLKDSLDIIKSLPQYNIFPLYSGDFQELYKQLNTKPSSSIEGIYSTQGGYALGVLKNDSINHYDLIHLSKETPLWKPGEIIGKLIPIYKTNKFTAIIGTPLAKKLITFVENIREGFFQVLSIQKDTSRQRYFAKSLTDSLYTLRELSPQIQYLKLGSFKSFDPVLPQAEKFYSDIAHQLSHPHLIIDLRNNSGGGQRNSNIIYKILKKYANQGNIHALINARTNSNAEQFTLKLKKLKHTTIYGDRSNGVLAYERTGINYVLPSGLFKVYLTGKVYDKYLPYESKGVEPDIYLKYDEDWIKQVNNLILN